jgi:hypothetical protein
MNPIPNYLSLWELAHLWHNTVPSSVDDSSVTREVRDTLLTLIENVLSSQMVVYDVVVGWAVDGEKKHSPMLYEIPLEEIPQEFEQMFHTGILDRNTLQAYRLSRESVFDWCMRDGYDPPYFCIPAWAMTEPKAEAVGAKVRPEAEDKTKCQEIAAKKWAENPRIRIAEMARDRAIRVEGSGGLYKEPTLLGWLREVAPDTVKGKPGRPRRENTPPK